MMILSTHAWEAALFPPDNIVKAKLVDYELGGIALNDISQGFTIKEWTFSYLVDNIYVDDIVLLSVLNVTELAGAFDRLMHPVVAYTTDANLNLYYYNGAEYVTIVINDVRNPHLTLDNKNISYCSTNGVVFLFYIKDNDIIYRTSQDNFLAESLLVAAPLELSHIKSVGLSKYNRLQIDFVYKNIPGIGCGSGDWEIGFPGDPTEWGTATFSPVTWGPDVQVVPLWNKAACSPVPWTVFPCGNDTGGGLDWQPDAPVEPTRPCP